MAWRSNPWGGSLELVTREDQDNAATIDGSGDRSAVSAEEEVKQSWVLRPEVVDRERRRKKKRCLSMNPKVVFRTLLLVLVVGGFVSLVTVLSKRGRGHHRPVVLTDNYTVALRQALMFFNAQRSGKLPKDNNVTWRGDSCLHDGETFLTGSLAGGYFDGGSAVKFTFPLSFSMTILSWSVLEYSHKYRAAGELEHVMGIIKWGTDYLLGTFDSSADSISLMAAQVGGVDDLTCWIRPEDILYKRPVTTFAVCPALAAETSAALSAASLVFRDRKKYSKKLLHGAAVLYKFATKNQAENYDGGPDPSSQFYNSTGFWDEFVWGSTWLYYASGNESYLGHVTNSKIVRKTRAFWGGPDKGVLSWDNKHAGGQLLLTRLRLFLQYGYPYEEVLREFHEEISSIMCSYLPVFLKFKRTKGGLIQLNRGKARPLQYVVNAAFMATLFSDYLEAILAPGWSCGDRFYEKEVLRDFAKSQINYILGENPHGMSYVVGFGKNFPTHVHHRGASIPDKDRNHGCKEGYRWKKSTKPNPNDVIGAMVGGPYPGDEFRDVRFNDSYTEPTIAGNAGLVAALVAVSGEKRVHGIDKNTIFYAVPPLFVRQTPPPPPWTPRD